MSIVCCAACCGVESDNAVVRGKVKDKNVLIIDSRTKTMYDEKHIDGAVNVHCGMPFTGEGAADAVVKAAFESGLLKEEDKERPVVVHCQAGPEANVTCGALTRAGFGNVTNAGSLERTVELCEGEKGLVGTSA